MADNIYNYLKENFNIETDYQFRRDYIKEPLKKGTGSVNRGEKPYKEDLEYLYISLNIRRNDLEKMFNMYSIKPWIKYYNLKKDSKNSYQNHIQTNLKKYGVEHYANTIEYKNKTIQTNLKKYGCSYPMMSKEVQNKSKRTNFLKLGVFYPGQSKKCMEKVKETNLKKYGFTCPLQNETIKEKSNKTMIKKYGCQYPAQLKEISSIIVSKSFETKKKNGTSNTSKIENELYKLLLTKFPNTIHHYKDNRYPFNCDFYIPELDLFIEYQGDRGHGNEPYIGSQKQNVIVNQWREKSKEINYKGKNKIRYLQFIKVWTERDVLKRKTAKDNGLNWIEFFNINQFMEWFNSQ